MRRTSRIGYAPNDRVTGETVGREHDGKGIGMSNHGAVDVEAGVHASAQSSRLRGFESLSGRTPWIQELPTIEPFERTGSVERVSNECRYRLTGFLRTTRRRWIMERKDDDPIPIERRCAMKRVPRTNAGDRDDYHSQDDAGGERAPC